MRLFRKLLAGYATPLCFSITECFRIRRDPNGTRLRDVDDSFMTKFRVYGLNALHGSGVFITVHVIPSSFVIDFTFVTNFITP
jgi:hypothetical protein